MTNYYARAAGQGNDPQRRSPNDNNQVHQGLAFPDTDPMSQGALGANAFLGLDLPNLNIPAGTTGPGFHSEVHFSGGFMDNQPITNGIPYQTTASMPMTTYGHQFVSPPLPTEPFEATFEGHSLERVCLSIPHHCDAEEHTRRTIAMHQNQQFHQNNPPVIPDHTLGEMAPKRVFPDFIKSNQNTTPEQRAFMERENNKLAAQLQKEDRARNNEAAKRSRLAKSESLANAIKLNIDQSIRIAWLEAKVISLGGNPAEFASIGMGMLEKMRNDVRTRMDKVYARRKKEKGEEEARRRALRNKERQRQKAAVNERFRQRAEVTRSASASVSASVSVAESSAQGAESGGIPLMDWTIIGAYDFAQE